MGNGPGAAGVESLSVSCCRGHSSCQYYGSVFLIYIYIYIPHLKKAPKKYVVQVTMQDYSQL